MCVEVDELLAEKLRSSDVAWDFSKWNSMLVSHMFDLATGYYGLECQELALQLLRNFSLYVEWGMPLPGFRSRPPERATTYRDWYDIAESWPKGRCDGVVMMNRLLELTEKSNGLYV